MISSIASDTNVTHDFTGDNSCLVFDLSYLFLLVNIDMDDHLARSLHFCRKFPKLSSYSNKQTGELFLCMC